MKKLFVVISALVTLLMPAVANAAAPTTGLHLTTSPLPLRMVTTPGTTVSTSLRVKNTGTTDEQLKMGLMKFSAVGENGRPNLFDRGPNDSYFDWVTFTPSVFTAPPNEWIDVKMTIKVPQTASLGYYYAVTFQRADNSGVSNKKTATSVIGATATMVLLEVKTSAEMRQLAIASFTSDHKLYSYLPVDFSVRVHNTGNIFLAPNGDVFVKRGNTTLATLEVNAAGGNVLPNSYRLFKTSWKDGFPVYVDKQVDGKPLVTKKGLPDRKLEWNLTHANKLRFGKYSAQVLMVYSDGNRDVPLEATLSFWVVPWQLLGLLILVLLLTALGLWVVGRGGWQRMRQRVRSRQ